jgi:hypothetical protein
LVLLITRFDDFLYGSSGAVRGGFPEEITGPFFRGKGIQ